jgi:chromosome segregation ATPase
MAKHRGRPNRGRTETLKQRAVYIYAPTEQMLANWKAEAQHYGMPLSKFLVEVIDDAMRKSPKGLTPRKKLEAELEQTASDLKAVRMQRDSMRSRIEELDATIASYRESLEDVLSYVPDEKLQVRMISLFLKRMTWPVDDFMTAMGVDASKPEELKKIQGIIEHLKRIGLVEGDFGKWRWLGGRSSKRIKASPEVERRKREAHRKRLSRRLRASRDDSAVGAIIRVKPE